MSKQKQEEKYIVDVIYEDIIEKIFQDKGIEYIKKRLYYVELFKKKEEKNKGNFDTLNRKYDYQGSVSSIVSSLRNGKKLTHDRREDIWSFSSRNWLSEYFLGAESLQELIKEELKGYLKKFLNEIDFNKFSVEEMIAMLIIFEEGNYIKIGTQVSENNFLLRRDLKEQLRTFLGINQDVFKLGRRKIIKISGPQSSGRHTLVEDVLREAGYDMIKFDSNDSLSMENTLLKTEANVFWEKRLEKDPKVEYINNHKKSDIELLENLKIEKHLAIVINVDNVNDYKAIERANNLSQKINMMKRDDISLIFIGKEWGDIITRPYTEDELVYIFLEKMGYSNIEVSESDGIREEKLREYCKAVSGQPYLVQLLVDYIKTDSNNDVGKKFEEYLQLFFEDNQKDNAKKIRSGGSNSKTISGHIRSITRKQFPMIEIPALFILACLEEYVPDPMLKQIGLQKAVSQLIKSEWYERSNLGIKPCISIDAIKKMFDSDQKNKTIRLLDAILTKFIQILEKKCQVYSFEENLYGIAAMATGLMKGTKKIEVAEKKKLSFYKSAILFFVNLGYPDKAEEFFCEYKAIHREKDLEYTSLRICIDLRNNKTDSYNEWVKKELSSDLRNMDVMRNEDRINFTSIMRVLLDNIVVNIMQKFDIREGIKGKAQKLSSQLAIVTEFARAYVEHMKRLKTNDEYLSEMKKMKNHYYTIFRILHILLNRMMAGIYDKECDMVNFYREEIEKVKSTGVLKDLEKLVKMLIEPENIIPIISQIRCNFIEDILFCVYIQEIGMKISKLPSETGFLTLIISDKDKGKMLERLKDYRKYYHEYSPIVAEKIIRNLQWEKALLSIIKS